MRFGGFLSATAHIAVVAWGLYIPLSSKFDATPSVIVPVDVIEVADMTSLIPVTDKAKIEDKPEEVKEDKTVLPSPAPPKAEEDTVNLPDANVAPPPKRADEPKKPEQKADPKKSSKDELDDFLTKTLAGIDKTPPKTQQQATANAAANNTKGPARMGAGEMRQNKAKIEDIIHSQLITKRCWTDHSDMADARRLHATIRVWFGPDMRFSRTPELIDPSRQPSGDSVFLTYIQFAFNALDKCNTMGWQVPEAYYRMEPAPYPVDITFLPGEGAR